MVDKNCAPKGYYAITGRTCIGCSFKKDDKCLQSCNDYVFCNEGSRPDKTNVIFKKRES